jgi:hypothetical protein
MQLRERVGMLDHDLRGERPRLHVPALLELEQVPPVAEHGTRYQPFQDARAHVPPPRPGPPRVYVAAFGRPAPAS